MEEIRIFIHTKNKDYGERLTRFAAGHHKHPVKVELLTEIWKKTDLQKEDFVLTDDEEAFQRLTCRCALLTKNSESTEDREIFMYQRRDIIYEQLLELAGVEREKKREKSSGKLYCVFSPEGGEEKTVLALKKAVELANEKRVLYVNMCEFPVITGNEITETPGEPKEGLSDLILCANHGEFEQNLVRISQQIGKIYIVAPVKNYRDLLDYTKEEIHVFLQSLREQEKFEAVILEIDSLFEYSLTILSTADEVILPQGKGVLGEIRQYIFQRYCHMEGQSELLERFHYQPVCGDLTKMTLEQIKQLLEG